MILPHRNGNMVYILAILKLRCMSDIVGNCVWLSNAQHCIGMLDVSTGKHLEDVYTRVRAKLSRDM